MFLVIYFFFIDCFILLNLLHIFLKIIQVIVLGVVPNRINLRIINIVGLPMPLLLDLYDHIRSLVLSDIVCNLNFQVINLEDISRILH